MFDNLVESGSHQAGLGAQRLVHLRYSRNLCCAFRHGVCSSALSGTTQKLGEQDLELTTLVAPVPVPQQVQAEKPQEAKPVKAEQNVDVRKELIADVSRTELVPKEVSAKASDIPPVRRGVTTVIALSRPMPRLPFRDQEPAQAS